MSGWGRTIGGGAAAGTLQQAELPVVEHNTCSRVNGRLAPVDEATMVCAGSGIANQAGGCQGDSGGPFVCEENGKWVLRGAVSWGNGMCTTDYYTVFARVSNFIDWINQKMSGGGSGGGGGGGSGKGILYFFFFIIFIFFICLFCRVLCIMNYLGCLPRFLRFCTRFYNAIPNLYRVAK